MHAGKLNSAVNNWKELVELTLRKVSMTRQNGSLIMNVSYPANFVCPSEINDESDISNWGRVEINEKETVKFGDQLMYDFSKTDSKILCNFHVLFLDISLVSTQLSVYI
jgi:hypothetical protein